MYVGSGGRGEVGDGGMQEVVHGDEVEEGAQVHRVQVRRRQVPVPHGGQGGGSRGELRRPGRRPPQGRLPLRPLRLRLRHGGQLPQEQDTVHRLGPGGVQDPGQNALRHLQGRAEEGSRWDPLRSPGHRSCRDGNRCHQGSCRQMNEIR
ncbi:unnamed protein product [Cuscuta campestris]|uniref:Uncharacterized protein n=1 Tax=Cuscuta campestris TaxID=132261 RepID=A0A484M331_9ASTE|nr:unnamed protein product [Cuscuta campestris]